MKYTFTKENGKTTTVEIPEKIIAEHKRNLGCTTKEAIDLFLFDEGYISDTTVEELTQKAKQNGAGVNGQSKSRKAPVRKPDMVKRELIEYVRDMLVNNDTTSLEIDNVEIKNIERIIAFSIGRDNYELTLSKKRAPKN